MLKATTSPMEGKSELASLPATVKASLTVDPPTELHLTADDTPGKQDYSTRIDSSSESVPSPMADHHFMEKQPKNSVRDATTAVATPPNTIHKSMYCQVDTRALETLSGYFGRKMKFLFFFFYSKAFIFII